MLYEILIITLSLIAAIVVLAGLAARVHLPYAILLVVGGAILGFIPGLPRLILEPDIVLLLFLPPLVYASAWFTSWRDFRAQLMTILMLAIGLVLVTMTCVAVIAHTFIPGMSWPVAFVLGAVVSPTDTVAASSIIQGQGIVRRVATIIEGESMVNDATGLVAYSFAVAATVNGTFSLWQASGQFVLVSAGGILAGIIVALPLPWLHKQIKSVSLQIPLTLLTPFAAYFLAEAFGLSGVLAVVATGLYLSRQSAEFFTANVRVQANSFWEVLIFLFNGFIFLLIGLQVHTSTQNATGSSLLHMLGYIALISVTVILVRIVWLGPTLLFLSWLNRHSPLYNNTPTWKVGLIISWAGMRGGVSLAIALALPASIANGAPFPNRDMLILITFGVIFVTLLLQGSTLGTLIRWMGLDNDPSVENEIREAIEQTTKAAMEKIKALEKEAWVPDEYVKNLHDYYSKRLCIVQDKENATRNNRKERFALSKRIHQEIRQTERQTAITLRAEGKISDQVFHKIERDLDLEEQRLQGRLLNNIMD